MDLRVARAVLHAKYHKFLELLKDLHRCEPRVVSLQEAADQLELQVTSYERIIDRLMKKLLMGMAIKSTMEKSINYKQFAV